MNCIVTNVTGRPVSFICNSGKAVHMPPKYKMEISMIEVSSNAFIEKLVGRRVLKINSEPKSAKSTRKSAAKSKTVKSTDSA